MIDSRYLVTISKCCDSFVNFAFMTFISGVNATHFVSVRFFAVWVTNFKAYFDGVEIQNKTLIGKGWNNELIHLPTALLAPSSHSLIFNYTDACGYRNESETIYIDEMIQGLSLQVF